MKPLTQQEYLISVGNECIVPSKIEAFMVFAKENLYGTIKIGIAHTKEGDTVCWLLKPKKGTPKPLKIFDDEITYPITGFTEMFADSCFAWQGKYFQIIKDKCLQLLIKEINCFSTEGDVYGYMYCKGYKNVEVYAVKMYRIGKKYEYVFPSWYVKLPENEKFTATFVPMFMEDIYTKADIDNNELNWEFMDPGDTFIHGNEIWRLYENEEVGLFINKAFAGFPKLSKIEK